MDQTRSPEELAYIEGFGAALSETINCSFLERPRVDMIVDVRVDYTTPNEQRLYVVTQQNKNSLTYGHFNREETYTSLATYWKERLNAPNSPTQD